MGALAVGRVRIALLLPVAALLLLAGTACGERCEPTGALVASYPVTVQGDRRQADRRRAPCRGESSRSAPGRRRSCTSLGLAKRTVAVDDTLVGLPLVDAIRRAKPDLIVASSETDPLDLARARSATHSAVYVEPGSSVGNVVQAIGDIGLLTGPRRPGAAADGPDRGQAPGRRQGSSPARRW